MAKNSVRGHIGPDAKIPLIWAAAHRKKNLGDGLSRQFLRSLRPLTDDFGACEAGASGVNFGAMPSRLDASFWPSWKIGTNSFAPSDFNLPKTRAFKKLRVNSIFGNSSFRKLGFRKTRVLENPSFQKIELQNTRVFENHPELLAKIQMAVPKCNGQRNTLLSSGPF